MLIYEVKLSRRFVEAIKLADRPAYRIALEAGIHPATLSKLIHGAERVRAGDRRVLAVARVVGLRPDQCFEMSTNPRQGRMKAAIAECLHRNEGLGRRDRRDAF